MKSTIFIFLLLVTMSCQIQGNRICGFGGLHQLQAPVTQMEGPDQRGGFIE